MDTSGFVTNSEWELLKAPCKKTETYYDCCPEPYQGNHNCTMHSDLASHMTIQFLYGNSLINVNKWLKIWTFLSHNITFLHQVTL